MYTNQQLTTLLRSHGYKVTPQRLAVYAVLAAMGGHPNAELLFQRLRRQFPAMSFATVYKTVEILRKIHAIQMINTGEDSFRYDANISAHHHVQCSVCGAVEDVTGLAAAGLAQAVAEQSGYALAGQQFYFYGICPRCRQQD